jgi:hypothetical protein
MAAVACFTRLCLPEAKDFTRISFHQIVRPMLQERRPMLQEMRRLRGREGCNGCAPRKLQSMKEEGKKTDNEKRGITGFPFAPVSRTIPQIWFLFVLFSSKANR